MFTVLKLVGADSLFEDVEWSVPKERLSPIEKIVVEGEEEKQNGGERSAENIPIAYQRTIFHGEHSTIADTGH
jgi:hypothetical protein